MGCLYTIGKRKDPEGVFKTPAQTGHFARLDMKKGIEKEADAKDDYERYLKNEKERREALRQVFFYY